MHGSLEDCIQDSCVEQKYWSSSPLIVHSRVIVKSLTVHICLAALIQQIFIWSTFCSLWVGSL